ncbi:MAG: hypothetical protein ABIF01_00625 [Candidatus Micrarchaeota archaeon]
MTEGEVDNSFYELNAQCWRCRMYVPRVEMKYHAGLLYCPICYQEVAEIGGRCQLCGSQLEAGEHQICRICKDKKRAKTKCPKCGDSLDNGICPKCSRGEHPEPPKQCPRCGSTISGWKCTNCIWESDHKPSAGAIACSACRNASDSNVWKDGKPYCVLCANTVGPSFSTKVLRRIAKGLNAIVKPKTQTRIKVKAKGESGAKSEKRDKRNE